MTVARITQNQADEVERLKSMGRTTNQIEIMLRLPYNSLRNGYQIDRTDEFDQVKHDRELAEIRAQFKRQTAAIRAELRGTTRIDGWRPDGDCVRSKPEERGGHAGRPGKPRGKT